MWLYKLAQKNMAMPFDWPYQSDEVGWSRQRPGYDAINNEMTEETAKQEQQKQPKYLGSGMRGVAVRLPSGFIGKYTNDIREVQLAQKLQDLNIPCVVKVHDVQIIQKSPLLYMITMDRVKMLSSSEKRTIDNIYDYFKDFMIYGKLHRSRNIEEEIQKLENGDITSVLSPRIFRSSIVTKYAKLIACLWRNEISMAEAHAYNIGYDANDNLVLFDLGAG